MLDGCLEGVGSGSDLVSGGHGVFYDVGDPFCILLFLVQLPDDLMDLVKVFVSVFKSELNIFDVYVDCSHDFSVFRYCLFIGDGGEGVEHSKAEAQDVEPALRS